MSSEPVAIVIVKFLLTFYYLFSIVFRLAFRFKVKFKSRHWIILAVDYAVDLFFVVDYLWKWRQKYRKALNIAPYSHADVDETIITSDYIRGTKVSPEPASSDTMKSVITNDRKAYVAFENLLAAYERKQIADAALKVRQQRTQQWHAVCFWTETVLDFLMMFPFEVVAYLCGYKLYYLLRTFRVSRVLYSKKYWADIVRALEIRNVIVGASGHRVLFLTFFMVIFAHLGACFFYALALMLMEKQDPVGDNWMTADGIAVFEHDTNTYYFTKPLRYRYVRAMYWSVVTSQTVGFGDVGPQSVYETSFCLCYFYMSHILAQLAIGNLILLVNVYDSARTKYRNQMEKLENYAKFRSLPRDLTDRIKSFYYHQWKVLNGLDEEQFLSELPHNIQTKVKQATVRDYLKNISILKNLRISILNALAEDVKTIMYSPHDVIVAGGSQAKGMYIISRGEAFVHSMSVTNTDKDLVISQALRQGESYGSKALIQKFQYSSTLSSGAGVCEVLFLSRSRFRRTLRLHMTDEEFARAIPSNPLIGGGGNDTVENSDEGNMRKTRRDNKHHSHIRAGFIQVELKSWWVDLFKPQSLFRNHWDIFIFVGMLFYSVTLPYLLSNSLDPEFFSRNIGVLVSSFLLDVVFAINLLLRSNFFSFYRLSVLFCKPEDILENFMRTENIYLEILSVLPLEILAVKFGVAFIPVLRLMKIYHLRNFVEYADHTEREISSRLGVSLTFAQRRFIRLYVALFELCHWVGCLWQLTADISTEMLGYDINWKIQDMESEFLHMHYTRPNSASAYRRSVYWAINGMATSGVADMPSTNLLEMIFCSLTLVCGCQTINALLGSIASLMGNINMGKRKFEAKIAMVKKLIKFKQLPRKLGKRIIYFFEYSWSRTSGANEVEVLAGLPQPLREDVVKFVAGSVLVKIPFFNDCIEPMLEMTLGLLTHRLFLEGDDLMVAGEHGKEMFVIESGAIVVTSPDKQIVYAVLTSGDYIGESCLLKVGKRTASAHARDYSDTYVLSKEDFQKVLEAFPGEGEIVVAGIEKVLEQKRRMNEETAKKRMQMTPSQILEEKKEREENTCKITDLKSSRESSFSRVHSWRKELEPGSRSRRLWDSFLFLILLYNLFMVPFRIALNIWPSLYALDYSFDVVLLLDSYLNWTVFRRSIGGKHITDAEGLRSAYYRDGFKHDILARFPYDLFALVLFGRDMHLVLKVMSYLRIPKILLILKGMEWLLHLESILEELKLAFVPMRLLQVLIGCLMVGHWLGCGLYLFSKAHPEDCVPEPGANYGTACEFRNTWVEFQILNMKLPEDGGTEISRYIRTINWAIPTMVLYVVGDVYPMNVNETSYVFGAMFFGISINAMIIGSIIALVSTLDEDLTSITTKSDFLRDHLRDHGIADGLIQKVTEHMKFLLTDSGQIILKESAIYDELPHSLQVAFCEHTKLAYFKQCPFFDFCSDEVLRNLCMGMKQQLFYTGDMIISFGDLGQEMYFIDRGTVEVLSADGKTVFTTLQSGGFFGETGLVFRSRRTANIRASSLCVCYSITKDQLDEELRDCDFDVQATIAVLCRLQETNAKRNDAVIRNLQEAKRQGSKLGRILGPVNKKRLDTLWVKLCHPHGRFKIFVDVMGILLLLYYAFSVPFEATFLFGDAIDEYRRGGMMAWDFTVDTLCFVELLLRIFAFPFGFEQHKQNVRSSARLYVYPFDMAWDIVGSIPLEAFVLMKSVNFGSIFALRLIHLLRLKNILSRVAQVEKHMYRNGLNLHRITLMVIKSIAAYLLVNHWTACMFFCVHRYLEYDYDLTWVIMDGYATYDEEKGTHDICSRGIRECYQRTMYFVGTVLTSVGYGDINPFTDFEMLMQVILAVIGACMGANICGQMSAFLQIGDQSGEMSFKEKMRSVEHYIRLRGLRMELRASILTNFRTMWRKERRIGDSNSSFLSYLTKPLAQEVAFELNRDVIMFIPMLKTLRTSLQRRIALGMKPQVLLPNTPVYSHGDTGYCVFFVLSGRVVVEPTKDRDWLDPVGVATLKILDRKHQFIMESHTVGTHFGEFCLMSKLGIRPDNATPTEITEVYYYDKEDIWDLFVGMPFVERYRFVLSLFTEVGGIPHTKDVVPTSNIENQVGSTSIKSLYKLCTCVANDVLDVIEGEDSDREGENDDDSSLLTAAIKPTARVRGLSIVSDNSEASLEELTGVSRWTEALKAYDRSRQRRASSKLGFLGARSAAMTAVVCEAEIEKDTPLVALEKRIRALFAYIDKDGSGSIDKNELMLSLLDLGIEKSWADVDSMIRFADKDGDEEVDLDELVAAIMREIKKESGFADVELDSEDCLSSRGSPREEISPEVDSNDNQIFENEPTPDSRPEVADVTQNLLNPVSQRSLTRSIHDTGVEVNTNGEPESESEVAPDERKPETNAAAQSVSRPPPQSNVDDAIEAANQVVFESNSIRDNKHESVKHKVLGDSDNEVSGLEAAVEIHMEMSPPDDEAADGSHSQEL